MKYIFLHLEILKIDNVMCNDLLIKIDIVHQNIKVEGRHHVEHIIYPCFKDITCCYIEISTHFLTLRAVFEAEVYFAEISL